MPDKFALVTAVLPNGQQNQWKSNTAHALRQTSLILDGVSLMVTVAGRESTALCSGALSTVLRLAAEAVEGPSGNR